MPRFRLLPAVIGILSLFFMFKVYDVSQDVVQVRALLASPAIAEDSNPEEGQAAAKEDEHSDEEKSLEEKEKEALEASEEKEAVEFHKREFMNPAVSSDPAKRDGAIKEFNQVEIDLLESLSKRREELDKWADEVKLKENMLKATEKRVDDKLKDMEALKAELEKLLVSYNKEENAKVKSLVKIYESMKPKDAARIFEELDMPTLLLVVDKMSERRVAPVIAAMSPEKAKRLTVELAESRKVKEKISGDDALR